ncbi:MAG: dienelactone hydrolase family protein [Gammaproteobacteria bacterium]|jgi:carboxymethylenebutenolidase
MNLTEDYVDLETPSGAMRTHRVRPAVAGTYPGVVLFSEIFQVTGPILRTARLLASRGYIVAIPEIYHEFEPPGVAFPYTPEGTDKGNRYKTEKALSAYDHDARVVLDHLMSLPECSGQLGCVGFCIGGHLAFRCAMNQDVLATACFYPTDIHKRSLGKGKRDDSLERAAEIKGELLMIFGRQDPHIPQQGRDLIYRGLNDAGANFTWHEFNAEHAFIRDEGYRYNASLAQLCHAMTFELFQRKLYAGEQTAVKTEGEGRH